MILFGAFVGANSFAQSATEVAPTPYSAFPQEAFELLHSYDGSPFRRLQFFLVEVMVEAPKRKGVGER
jgi:hypothetical protein